jgi:phenylpropionate dioxygenase-like ring-hydroxylating dioxygenase large terminal subunit
MRLSPPVGWFAVAFAHELRGRRRLRRKLLGEELVVARAASGAIEVVGRAGRSFAVHERHGVVLAYSEAEVTPAWEPKPIEAEHASLEWSRPATRLWRVRTHPQEILENTVDVSHFRPVHDFASVEIVKDLRTDGPHLSMSYAVTRKGLFWGEADPTRLSFRFDVNASGLGYSRVQVGGLPVRLRTVVMPTPVEDGVTEIRVLTQVEVTPGRGHWAAPLLPRGPLAALGARLALREVGKEVAADIVIWEHKRYQDPPRLVDTDGPIGPYRKWARQFLASPVAT